MIPETKLACPFLLLSVFKKNNKLPVLNYPNPPNFFLPSHDKFRLIKNKAGIWFIEISFD